jgi:deazaflavin-dependent oxidoreductase (nitroreductase family)
MGSAARDRVVRFVMLNGLTRPHRVLDRLTGGRIGLPVPSVWVRTTGRRTGEPRRTPLVPAREGTGTGAAYLVAASSGGMERTPAWAWNLRGHAERGDPVVVEDRGRGVLADVTELTGAERDAAFARLVAVYRGFAGYQRHARRTIPVFRLAPREEAPSRAGAGDTIGE